MSTIDENKTEDIMDNTRKGNLIDELLEEVVEKILDRPEMYFPSNFSLKDIVLENKIFRQKASKIIDKILTERQSRGIVKSTFDDTLFDELVKGGKTVVWSDVTGVVLESDYNASISELESLEKEIGDEMKAKLIDNIISTLAVKDSIINGYFFAKNKNATVLLPKRIKDLQFYETEDIYDYMGIEIVDSLGDLFVCESNDGAKVKSDSHNKNYLGTLVSADNSDLIGIKEAKAGVNKTYIGILLIPESKIGE